MLEQLRQFCTKKRMIFAIVLLGLLTILLLIFEEALTTQEERKPTSSPKPVINDHVDINKLLADKIPANPSNSAQAALSRQDSQNSCWLKESFTVELSCTPCSDFEINSKSPPACVETGLKEIVRCSVSGLATRSRLSEEEHH